MRKIPASFRSVLLMIVLTVAVGSPALADPAPRQSAARAEAAVLPPPSEPGGIDAAAGRRGDTVDLRDSAALVLVGTMLIGLAAAVRRTA